MMKKLVLMIITMIVLESKNYTVYASMYSEAHNNVSHIYQPPEQSREELYQDIFISLLIPYIQRDINNYYSDYLTGNPTVAPYFVFVLSVERPNGYRTFVFDIKLDVESYTGPHLAIGSDYLAYRVDGSGNVELLNFKHIKSYELPPNYQNIIKK